jgi:hypothetical protein
MEIRKPYKSRWFCAFGPNREMIIDNNQNKLARIFGLSQGIISACLRGERRGHKGWKFIFIENPQPFAAAEKKKKSVTPETEPILQKPIPTQKKESNAKHMEAATEAGIRHLMADLYPQWCGVNADGYIFTG